MFSRWSFIFAALIATGLACNLFNPEPRTTITNVSVTPSAGSGDFTLAVSYKVEGARAPGEIICHYVDPDGGYHIIDILKPGLEDLGFDERSEKRTFSATKPGSYQALCESKDKGGNSMSTFFRVTEKVLTATITKVAVSPSSGSGSFSLEVNFDIEKYDETTPGDPPKVDPIRCFYISPETVMVHIDSFSPAPTDNKRTLVFSVTKPGNYSAGCQYGEIQMTAPFQVTEKVLSVTITNVSVSPASGNGKFTLEVNFEVEEYDAETLGYTPKVDSIHCFYVTPDGATMGIRDFSPLASFNEVKRRLDFTATKPGAYTAGCQTFQLNSQMSTAFQVTEPAKLLTGYIEFDHNNDVFTPHIHNHGIMDYLHEMCAPKISITESTLTGDCDVTDGDPSTASVPGDHTGGAKIHGSLQGQIGTDGMIHFTYTVTSKYMDGDPNWWATKEIVYEGTGKFTSSTTAEGPATYKYTCAGGVIEANHCGTSDVLSNSDSFTGTIPWKFVPLP